MWDYAEHDPELTPIRTVLGPFLACLRRLIPSGPAKLNQEDTEALLTQAIDRISAR